MTGSQLRATACICAAAALSLTALSAGCGGSPETSPQSLGLDSEYVSVELTDTYVVLMLGDDGSFALIQDEPMRYGEESKLRRGPQPLAVGTWSFSESRLDLEGDGWTVTFESDSTRVEIPDRADTISSLRWVTSTEGSPFSACDLVSASEFKEFLHPTEGSGSEGM